MGKASETTLRFIDEVQHQFKKELGIDLMIEILKMHSLFYALEQTKYQELSTITTREALMRLNPREVKKNIADLYQKLRKMVPALSDVLTDNDNFDGQTIHKLVVLLNHHGLTREEYTNSQSVTVFFDTVVEECLANLKAGYLMTPHGLTQLMIRAINPDHRGIVYDPTAGIANLMVAAYRHAQQQGKHLTVYGQEIDKHLYAIGKLNLFLHDILPDDGDMRLGDTIQDPKWLKDDHLMQFDYIVMNYPFGLSEWGYDFASNDPYNRFLYGLPSRSKGDYAFILHALASLKSNGRAAVVVPFGALVGSIDRKIRAALVKEDVIESVIALPDNLFSGTGIPVALLIFNKNKPEHKRGKVQLINAEGDYRRTRTQRFLEEEHIQKIIHALEGYTDVEQYSRIVSIREIEDNNFDLNPVLYFVNVLIETEFGTVKFKRDVYEGKTDNLVQIGDVAEVIRGVNLPGRRQLENAEGERYPVIQIKDVEDGTILFDNLEHLPVQPQRLERVVAKPGDILVSGRGTRLKIAVVPEYEGTVLVSSMFVILRLRDSRKQRISPYYIKRFLESPIGQYYLTAHQRGTMAPVLTPNDIGSIPLPLIDINKQNEMVRQLEEADELVQKALEERKKRYFEAYQSWLFSDLAIELKEESR